MEILFTYDQESLLFKKTNKLLKYRLLLTLFIILFSTTLISSISYTTGLKNELEIRDSIIKEKQNRIDIIKTPLRTETYVEDLYNNIGFKLSPDQYKKFEELSIKYRNQIEEAHVPATLVWWIAFKESRFNSKASNSTSTAKGMFQFLDGTWRACCKMSANKTTGRFDEEKQVEILLVYLNYLYNKYGNWEKSMNEYHGGAYQYPIKFLFK